MAKSLLRTDKEIADIYFRHVKTIYRVCFAYMKTTHDAEDAVHDAFMKMITSSVVFESEEHEKAWLIRAAVNVCKNALKHWWRKMERFDDHADAESRSIETDDMFDAICALPEKYKTVILLYYYEGYTSAEIAKMLRRPQSTITNYMSEARRSLRKTLGGDFDGIPEKH
ncbi:MAG: RNA polymerase sigma factor [Oscillospiraceae bacterium]|nr:RNA polymerase sigma factor [Oscillospiraceae bacterium]